MADYNQLKASIAAVIKTNNRKEITGQLLQNVLFQMTEVIGENYQLAGFATPQTNPHEPDQNVFYITDESGTFPYFDNIILGSGISFLMWKNGQWTSHTVNGVTQEWVRENFISKEYFRSLFRAYDANGDEILPNNDPEGTLPTVVDNIKAMVGFWTEQYISALGHGTGGGGGGGGGGATTLDGLDDVVILNPQNGQGLIFDSTSGKWINQNIPTGTDMATVWTALAGATNQQINISHLTDALATYATQTWVGQNYISIAYFDRLFRAYNGSTLVSHNDTTSTIDNIKAMFGFWTEFYVSSLGIGGLQSPIGLASLNDIALTTPIGDGQVLTYNASTGKWNNANAQTGVTALANLTDVTLTSLDTNQILVYNANTQKWVNSSVKTINGNSIFGTGDIPASGGTGAYLPLAGGLMTGNYIWFPSNQSYYSTSYSGICCYEGTINMNVRNNKFVIALMGTNGYVFDLTYLGNGTHTAYLTSNGGMFPNSNNQANLGELNHEYANTDSRILWARHIQYSRSFGNDNALFLQYDWTGTSCGDTYINANNNGKVGIGTTMPKFKLDVNGYALVNGELFICYNGIGFNRNATNGNIFNTSRNGGQINYSSTYEGLEFGTVTGSGSYNTRMVIALGGNVGIGNNYPSYTLHVAGTIYATGAITALSDARMKDITGEAGINVEQIAHAPAVQFLWKDKERRNDGQQVGTLAQYWQTVLPEVVSDKGGELSMQYGVAALVSAIVTARKVVDHERRISELERENERLRTEVEQLRLN